MSALINIETEDASGARAPLADAWVYFGPGPTVTVMRTDADGHLLELAGGGDATRPWDYTTRHAAVVGDAVDLYYSRGAKPIPNAELNRRLSLFFHRIIAAGQAPASEDTMVSINNINVLQLGTSGTITVPLFAVTLESPRELRLWPILWELPSQPDPADDDKPYYHTGDIQQGAAWWPGTENAVSAAPPMRVQYNGEDVFIRPRERGLRIQGQIDARATAGLLQILDGTGNAIPLRTDFDPASAPITDVALTLSPAVNGMRPFVAEVFFRYSGTGAAAVSDAANHFGPAQILVTALTANPPIVEAFAGHLCGLQLNLVDDFMTDANGQSQGPLRGEAEEIHVVDFRNSPTVFGAPVLNSLISAETRARRMLAFEIVNQSRLLDPSQAASAANPTVLKPQMPMWMAEAEVVGLSRVELTDLQWRFFQLNAATPAVSIQLPFAFQWQLQLEWSGPDKSTGNFGPTHQPEAERIKRAGQHHSYQYNAAADGIETINATLHFNSTGALSDVAGTALTIGNDNRIPGVLTPDPTAPTFPVAGRRLPGVFLDQDRRWGRHTGAVQRPSLVFEWQPLVTINAAEAIRGGNGIVNVPEANLDGVQVHTWAAPENAATGDPQPDMRTPYFRVRSRAVTGGPRPIPAGDRIPVAEAETLIHALVQQYFDQHNPTNTIANNSVALLPLTVWQVTARRIFHHENRGGTRQYYRQFDERTSGRYQVTPHYWGQEGGMPLFGYPHGYGFGQLDEPAATPDQVWSFVENIREAVRRIFETYGAGGLHYLTTAVISNSATKVETALTTIKRNSFPPTQAGTVQYEAARAAALAAAAAAGAAFQALPLGVRQAIYQRELVRRYNGGREFRYETLAGVQNWVVHTSQAKVAHQPYPNRVLGTTIAEPGPSAFNQTAPIAQ